MEAYSAAHKARRRSGRGAQWRDTRSNLITARWMWPRCLDSGAQCEVPAGVPRARSTWRVNRSCTPLFVPDERSQSAPCITAFNHRRREIETALTTLNQRHLRAPAAIDTSLTSLAASRLWLRNKNERKLYIIETRRKLAANEPAGNATPRLLLSIIIYRLPTTEYWVLIRRFECRVTNTTPAIHLQDLTSTLYLKNKVNWPN